MECEVITSWTNQLHYILMQTETWTEIRKKNIFFRMPILSSVKKSITIELYGYGHRMYL